MIEVPFFSFDFSLGISVSGLALALLRSKDDQRRLFFAVLLHALREVLVVLGELDFDVEFARGLLNLGREEEIVNERQRCVSWNLRAKRAEARDRRRERRSKARTRSARALAVIAITGQRGAIAVIHGSGVDAVLIVARLAGSGGTGPAHCWDGVRDAVDFCLRHRRVFLVLRS
jgi:hypothetical protein